MNSRQEPSQEDLRGHRASKRVVDSDKVGGRGTKNSFPWLVLDTCTTRTPSIKMTHLYSESQWKPLATSSG